MTLLELAAIYLTDGPEATFTEDEILDQAVALGGVEVPLDREDARIVLRASRFVARSRDGRLRLR